MSDLFGIAIVAAVAATLFEIRYWIIGGSLLLAFFKLGQWVYEGWQENRARKNRDRLAILSRADRQHREVLAGDPHGVYGTDATQIVFRDVARRISEETEGFTRPLTREMPALTPGCDSRGLFSPTHTIPLGNAVSSAYERPPQRSAPEFPVYPKPTDWHRVIDLDAT